ncbi:EutN/CcmL family microcompartment protein [Gordoniibacillus kamchatkensis]|uniref:EutN/CcmL family microcompartment protein n=1 Tax=Gordoniibacillus kamchatkensis TaxID=1590651 RepID=UPI0009E3C7D9|nr:EutN/CcmL family microcompartment protein [Paenibacillus sp. VKM B-2647]
MLLGRVIGSVWATQKEEGMENLKFMIVQPIGTNGREAGHEVVAADRIGAGVGEKVLVSRGSPARVLFGGRSVPIDAMIVCIVDSFEVEDESETGPVAEAAGVPAYGAAKAVEEGNATDAAPEAE